MSRDLVSARRCLAVWLAVTVASGLLVAWTLPPLVAAAGSPPPADRFEDWLVVGCDAAAVAGVGWLWVLVSLVILEASGTAARRHRGVPTGVRRAVLAACGAGLVGGLVAPAHASSSPLDGLPLPDRPASVAVAGPAAHAPRPAAATTVRPAARPSVRTVRVAPGDTLWELAAADLPAGASAADIDARWRAVHAANREVVGPDPDLIRPGQQLRLPPDPSA